MVLDGLKRRFGFKWMKKYWLKWISFNWLGNKCFYGWISTSCCSFAFMLTAAFPVFPQGLQFKAIYKPDSGIQKLFMFLLHLNSETLSALLSAYVSCRGNRISVLLWCVCSLAAEQSHPGGRAGSDQCGPLRWRLDRLGSFKGRPPPAEHQSNTPNASATPLWSCPSKLLLCYVIPELWHPIFYKVIAILPLWFKINASFVLW